jgi:hypothetical protein
MPSPAWWSLLTLILGALIGGLVNAGVASYTAFRESQGIAAALRAEVGALLDLVKIQRFESRAAEIVARLDRPDHRPTLDDIFSMMVSHEYFPVFDAVVARIGALGTAAGRVVRFYTLSKSLLEDVACLNRWREEVVGEARRGRDPAPQLAALHDGILARTRQVEMLLRILTDEGAAVVTELQKIERARWLGVLP